MNLDTNFYVLTCKIKGIQDEYEFDAQDEVFYMLCLYYEVCSDSESPKTQERP